MKSLLRLIAALSITIAACAANATPLEGEATVYDPTGNVVTAGQPITGDLDVGANAMSVDPWLFFGFFVDTASVELLGPGTYTRSDSSGVSTTATVGADQLGAYILLEWSFNEFGTFMVWDVTPNSSGDGGAYVTVDSDGDGIPGHALVSGPFAGFTLTYDFVVAEPPPGIKVSIVPSGGNTQECSTIGGSDVELSADVTLLGGALLGSIAWTVDGADAGSGGMITPYLALGVHTVDVTATTTTGQTDSDSADITVRDTTRPDLDVAFLDNAGNVVTTASAGSYVTVQVAATDICDPQPQTKGSANPVYEVSDGDNIKLQSGKVNTVELPTTAIELTGTAADASGNTSSGNAVLSITN